MKCLYCGKEITKKSHKKNGIRKYCDMNCYRLDRGCIDYKYTICNYCGKTFKETRDRPNLYCSKICANKGVSLIRINRLEKETLHNQILFEEYQRTLKHLEELRYRLEHEKICAICGEVFIAKNTSQICCSKKCSNRNKNIKKDKRIYKNGKPDLSINLSRLYKRDNGVCQICGRCIDFNCDSNSDYYPSIDHIKPIAKGGLHSWDNVQLACRKCNTIKGVNTLPL